LQVYKNIYENILLVPVIDGIKTETEKFCGANYTTTIETYISECGKSIQSATSHSLGQNFSKMFDIKFQNELNSEEYVWQNSWGLSTRSIGVMLMVHSDNKGLILPPKVANTQIIVVTKEDKITNKEDFETFLNTITDKLHNYRILFERSDKSLGVKFNESEMKGIPLRIEIGNKEFETQKIVIFRRDKMEKIKEIEIEKINFVVEALIKDIEKNMYEKAKNKFEKSILQIKNIEEFKKNINEKALLVSLCGNSECEKNICTNIKNEMNISIKTLCIPYDKKMQEVKEDNCIWCNNNTKNNVLFGKSF
jgi:prolyl-tRNA synthetase family I